MYKYDVIIIGGGAAGLTAAGAAVSRGRDTAILDMGNTLARKVALSGGGKCNFTNTAATADKYFGKNPDFVRSAIARITPEDVLDWAKQHKILYKEKAPGQYFSATNSLPILNALMQDARKAKFYTKTLVSDVSFENSEFKILSESAVFYAKSVIIATGGISFPSLGVSDVGYKIAENFGHKIIPVRPALCAIETNAFSSDLAGISVGAEITIGRYKIRDSMLFTHFGIGGPAIYRATVRDFDVLKINMTPDVDIYQYLRDTKKTMGRKSLSNVLSFVLPIKLAKWFCKDLNKNLADCRDVELTDVANRINNTLIKRQDIKLHGINSAEVVRGGVDTSQISSKTMESLLRPGLFFAGEVIDIAGDLGGFNLHWAWASGKIAGQNA